MPTIKPTQDRDYICDFRQPEADTFVSAIEASVGAMLPGFLNIEDAPSTPVPAGRCRIRVPDCTDELDGIIMSIAGVERALTPDL